MQGLGHGGTKMIMCKAMNGAVSIPGKDETSVVPNRR